MTTPLQLTPTYHHAKTNGARFQDLAGWRLVHDFGDAAAEREAVRGAAGLYDASASGKLLIEGSAAMTLWPGLWAAPTLAVGAGIAIETGMLYRLRADLCLLHTPPGGQTQAAGALAQVISAQKGLISLTDMTHGWAELRLIGPASREVLSRLCGLDLSQAAYPDHHAAFTSVAKTRQLLLRQDADALPAFSLIGARSLAVYLWQTLLAAGQDLGLQAVGWAAIGSR